MQAVYAGVRRSLSSDDANGLRVLYPQFDVVYATV